MENNTSNYLTMQPPMHTKTELLLLRERNFNEWCAYFGDSLNGQLDVNYTTKLLVQYNKYKKNVPKFQKYIMGMTFFENSPILNDVMKTSITQYQQYHNPLYSNPIPLSRRKHGHISCYGENGSTNYWKSEEYSGSDKTHYCLNEAFDLGWEVKPTDVANIIQLANCWNNLGFETYFVTISSWRKGYDYTVYSLDDVVANRMSLEGLCEEYFRAYVEKI